MMIRGLRPEAPRQTHGDCFRVVPMAGSNLLVFEDSFMGGSVSSISDITAIHSSPAWRRFVHWISHGGLFDSHTFLRNERLWVCIKSQSRGGLSSNAIHQHEPLLYIPSSNRNDISFFHSFFFNPTIPTLSRISVYNLSLPQSRLPQ